ncbi:uncharacterized protein [Venturia canescens]|nr:uncharacterized protein LOC122406672 [Venturia canescens]
MPIMNDERTRMTETNSHNDLGEEREELNRLRRELEQMKKDLEAKLSENAPAVNTPNPSTSSVEDLSMVMNAKFGEYNQPSGERKQHNRGRYRNNNHPKNYSDTNNMPYNGGNMNFNLPDTRFPPPVSSTAPAQNNNIGHYDPPRQSSNYPLN